MKQHPNNTSEMTSHRRKWSFPVIITLFIFWAVWMAIILEMTLRVMGFAVMFGTELHNKKSLSQKTSMKILAIGDSVTNDSSSESWPQQLELILNTEIPGKSFSVINKGVPGATTTTILRDIHSYLITYHPDIVIAMAGINDSSIAEKNGYVISDERATDSQFVHDIKQLKIYKLVRMLLISVHNFSHTQNDNDLTGVTKRENQLKQAIAAHPADDALYVSLGNFYVSLGLSMLGTSKEMFIKAIALNPKNDMAYVGLGNRCHLLRQQCNAEELYQKALAINPRNNSAQYALGVEYFFRSEFARAESAYRKVLERNPNDLRTILKLAELFHYQLNNLPEAEHLYTRYTRLTTDNAIAYFGLASLYTTQNRAGEAAEMRKRAESVSYAVDPTTRENYRQIRNILKSRRIPYVAAQYPLRSVNLLKEAEGYDPDIIYVDNESTYIQVLQKEPYEAYFRDRFAGDFGHGTQKGNHLIAQNIADTIFPYLR